MILLLLFACKGPDRAVGPHTHGPIADGISAPLGEPLPFASAEQREIFARGKERAEHRFTLDEGLGPSFNVSFCVACHERPVTGGSAGHYRDFSLVAVEDADGAFFPTGTGDALGGVIRLYDHEEGQPARPVIDPDINVVARRNPIPFFGVGLLAELDNATLLSLVDPDDTDGDGISGRPNYDRGFVGRFGRKAQTVSLEGFIRGPAFNHMGITTDPLSEEQKAALPVDSSGGADAQEFGMLRRALAAFGQAAAPDAPLTDEDGVADPEMSTDNLFDLVSFAMLMAAPQVEADPEGAAFDGLQCFDQIGCDRCHTPRIEGPRGPLPVYSDLLLHDMGADLSDGFKQGEAEASEFRTQPLWGIAAVGPYLHDGRADTLALAIEMHGGEGEEARDGWLALSTGEQEDLLAFLATLGGEDQASPGLIPPDEIPPAAGEWGGPVAGLSAEEEARFGLGRALFDRDFLYAEGLGGPRMNGDSCRACHFEPEVGGSGPPGVDVMRHGILNADGDFVPPVIGTILHRLTALPDSLNRPQVEANIFELRQTPHLFGLGLVDGISEEEIASREDPEDLDGDGISGRISWTDGGRVGRLGWKAQVPSLAEFVRDAFTSELGLTIAQQEALDFGRVQDDDAVEDPEISVDEAELLLDYLRSLGPPPRGAVAAAVEAGEALFGEVGCAACHSPALVGALGPVPLYSDLLLHEVLAEDALGIEDAGASMREFRTAPLWGLRETAPYLHDGSAGSILQAIAGHEGEAAASREAALALSDADLTALLAFLESL